MTFLNNLKIQAKSKIFLAKYSKAYIESLILGCDNNESWANNKLLTMQRDTVYCHDEFIAISTDFYKNRAKNDDSYALYKLGAIYYKDDINKAQLYLEGSANLGNISAMKELAYRYDEPCNEYSTYGFGVDLNKRDYWLNKALDLNDSEAMHYVAKLIMDGQDTFKRDINLGLELLDKSIASGYLKAYFTKGEYYNQIVFSNDIEQFKKENYERRLKAIEAYENAVNYGNDWEKQSNAALEIGLIYGNDFIYGKEKNQYISDANKALYWLLIASYFGNDSAEEYIEKITRNTSQYISNDQKLAYLNQFRQKYAKPFYCNVCNKTYFFDKNADITECPICFLNSKGIYY